MSEQQTVATAITRHERAIAGGVVVLLVLLRSVVFVFWEQAHFDSDQAITGLMAKHLSQLRAFPVFYYGQNYMLAVEAWLAAPVFVLAGASVAALKLPLLAINIAIALLLLRTIGRETGLRPFLALLPALFFALPPPGTAARLVEANGGNVEPMLYIILLWLTRARPGWGGLILGVGFLQREFTIYGFIALLIVEAFEGSLFTKDGVRRRLVMLRTTAEVWLLVQWIKQFSSAAGPGTSLANIYHPRDNLSELVSRMCVAPAAALRGVAKLVTEHWPVLFGTRVTPLGDFGIESRVHEGLPGSWLFLLAAILLPVIIIGARLVRDRRWRREYTFCSYLVLVASLSAAGYVAGRCGEIGFGTVRYDLLSLIGAVGLGAWFLSTRPSKILIRTWMVCLAAWLSVSGLAHTRLLAEYLGGPPVGAKQLVVSNLRAQGVHYAVSDYWIAYAVTFMTDEQVIVASEDFVRIPAYHDIVQEHVDKAVRISRSACVGGRTVTPGLYICPQ
jgi:uncharacterized membrane protein